MLSDKIVKNIFIDGSKYFLSVRDLNETEDLSLLTEVLKIAPVDSKTDAISSEFIFFVPSSSKL